MRIIRTEKDLESLEFGEGYLVEVANFEKFAQDPDGPIKLIESKEWAEAQKLETLAAEKFSSSRLVTDTGFVVDLSDTHLTVTATRVVTVELGGDVRDGTRTLQPGDSTKRKLNKENHGWVSVNGTRYQLGKT